MEDIDFSHCRPYLWEGGGMKIPRYCTQPILYSAYTVAATAMLLLQGRLQNSWGTTHIYHPWVLTLHAAHSVIHGPIDS